MEESVNNIYSIIFWDLSSSSRISRLAESQVSFTEAEIGIIEVPKVKFCNIKMHKSKFNSSK